MEDLQTKLNKLTDTSKYRLKANSISQQGRPATGVRAQNLVDNDSVVSVQKIVNTSKNDEKTSNDTAEITETEENSEQTKIELNSENTTEE